MKVLELVLLFVACFSAVFNVLCYFLNLSLLPNIFYHFILAVVCIIIVIVVLFIYLKSDATVNSEKEFEEDNTDKQKLKEDNVDDNNQLNPVNSFENDLAEDNTDKQKLNDVNDDNQQLNPVNSFENDLAEDNNLENKEMIEENISNQEDIVEENEFDESNDIIDKSDGFAKTIQNDKNELSFSIDQNNKVDSELTNTQILYINNSDNSYIDDRGLPQLVVTKEIDSQKVSNAYLQQQLTDQQKLLELQKEEEQYLLEEKQERTIEILKVVLVILVIVNLLLLAYFIYLRVL